VLPISLLMLLRLVVLLKLPLPAALLTSLLMLLRPVALLKLPLPAALLTSLLMLLQLVALPTNRKKSLLPVAPLAALATSNCCFPPRLFPVGGFLPGTSLILRTIRLTYIF